MQRKLAGTTKFLSTRKDIFGLAQGEQAKTMTFLQIVILAVIQGLAELLPVASSAHVIAAAKLMHLDPSAPSFTLLLVMLHTGTMFAVIVYFWSAWRKAFFSSRESFNRFAVRVIVATIVTVVI